MDPKSTDNLARFRQLFDAYKTIISVDVQEYISGKAHLVFPIAPQSLIESLCEECTDIFRREPVVLDLPHKFTIIGDLHGHILDLFRILSHHGFPPRQNYLFLGDIVDRGEFSLETITLVYLMKALWPKNVYIIRGNHEFAEMCQRCGFSAELFNIYRSPSVESAFLTSFSWMPLGAVINHTILCIHGGIGPHFKKVEQLRTTMRPFYEFGDEPATTVLWSDPVKTQNGFHPSCRGSGYFFGCDVLINFLKETKLSTIVRGHECVEGGVDVIGSGKLITVFSASYYCGDVPNRAGVLILNPNGEREAETYPALPYFLRSRASFVPFGKSLHITPSVHLMNGPKSVTRPVEKLPSLTGLQRRIETRSQTTRPFAACSHMGDVHSFSVPVARPTAAGRELPTRMKPRNAPPSGLRVRCLA